MNIQLELTPENQLVLNLAHNLVFKIILKIKQFNEKMW